MTPDEGPIEGGTTVLIDCVDLSSIGMFAAGGQNAMIVTTTDDVLSWGDWQRGASGSGGGSSPAQIAQGAIPVDADIVDADYGLWNGYVLASDGSVYSWGMNSSGELGDNSFPAVAESSVSVKVSQGAIPSGVKATSVVAGSGNAGVVTDSGWIYTWGSGVSGINGDGTTAWRDEPVALVQGQIPAGVTLTQLAIGNGNGYALGSDGWIYSWGANFEGALGNGSTSGPDQTSPVRVSQGAVPAGVTFTQIAAGNYSAYGLGTDGNVYSWGYNGNGLLGIGDTVTPRINVPALVTGGDLPAGVTVTKVIASELHAMIVASDGNVYSWGNNESGQLGNDTMTKSASPVRVVMTDVPAGVTFTDAELGDRASYALGSDGRLYSWGAMLSDQTSFLGSNATEGRMRPALAVSFGTTEVTFDGIPGTNLDASGCPISVVTPPHAHGSVDVVVTTGLIAGTTPTGYQSQTTIPGGFTYVEPPVITTPTLPDGLVDQAYTATVATTGAGPITLAVTAGELPAGLTLDPNTGLVSGTPTTAGSYTFTVTATNQYGTDTQEYTIVIRDTRTPATSTPTPTTTTGSATAGGTSGGTGTGGATLALTGGTAAFAGIAGLIGALLTIGGSIYLVMARKRARA